MVAKNRYLYSKYLYSKYLYSKIILIHNCNKY